MSNLELQQEPNDKSWKPTKYKHRGVTRATAGMLRIFKPPSDPKRSPHDEAANPKPDTKDNLPPNPGSP